VLKSESLVPTGNGCQSGISFCGASKECSRAVEVKSVVDVLRVGGDIKGRVILNNQQSHEYKGWYLRKCTYLSSINCEGIISGVAEGVEDHQLFH
jgi:hypothetical protein